MKSGLTARTPGGSLHRSGAARGWSGTGTFGARAAKDH